MTESTTRNTVQLGCGTLIVIALIVMVFSGGKNSDTLQKSMNELHVKVDRLETKIDELSRRLPPAPDRPVR
jgi:hypothetical protein